MVNAGNVAVVSYLAGQLAGFLDSLRLELTPLAGPRAHVTILPPRPLPASADHSLECTVQQECGQSPVFVTELGDVAIFPGSNVVYLNVLRGADQMRCLHHRLNQGLLEYSAEYSYHPHLTLAQGLTAVTARELAPIAIQKWAEYPGPRSFLVESVSLIRQTALDRWSDIAQVGLVLGSPCEYVGAAVARAPLPTAPLPKSIS